MPCQNVLGGNSNLKWRGPAPCCKTELSTLQLALAQTCTPTHFQHSPWYTCQHPLTPLTSHYFCSHPKRGEALAKCCQMMKRGAKPLGYCNCPEMRQCTKPCHMCWVALWGCTGTAVKQRGHENIAADPFILIFLIFGHNDSPSSPSSLACLQVTACIFFFFFTESHIQTSDRDIGRTHFSPFTSLTSPSSCTLLQSTHSPCRLSRSVSRSSHIRVSCGRPRPMQLNVRSWDALASLACDCKVQHTH